MEPSLEPEPLAQRPQAQELDEVEAGRGATIAVGGVWHAAERFVPQFYTLAISIVAARYLGPHDMGRQSYIAFASLAITALLSSSLWTALVRYVAESVGRGEAAAVRSLLAWAWRIEAVAALIGGGGLAVAALTGSTPRNAWLLAGGVTAAAILQTVPSAILVGLQRFRQSSIVGITTGIVGTVATVIVLQRGGGIAGMFAVEVAIGIVNLAWSGVIAQRALAAIAPRAEPAGALKRAVFRFAVGYSAGVVLELIVARRSELFFLDKFSTNQQIAYYSIAYAVVTGVGQIPAALAAAAGPMFAALYGAGGFERMQRGFDRARRLLLLFTLPLTAAGLALGPRIIGAIYGGAYGAAGAPLLIMLAVFPLRGTTSLANTVTNAYGKLRVPVTMNWIAATIDVGLAAALVPILDARGAAVASVAAQLVYSAAVMFYARRLLGGSRIQRSMVRVTLASALTGGAAFACVASIDGLIGLLIGLAAFVVLFPVSAAAFRIIPANDAAWIEDAIAARLGDRARWVCRTCSARA